MLKDKLISSFLAMENELDRKDSIHSQRTAAMQQFEAVGFPAREEEWKYTSLKKVLKEDYNIFPSKTSSLESKDVRRYFLDDLDSYKLVFVDGKFQPHLSSTTHEGVDVCTLKSALSRKQYQPVIEAYFNKIAGTSSMASLNTAFAQEGAYIYVPAGKEVRKPIEIVHFATGDNNQLLLQPRSLVVAGENAQVQIIERHQSLNGSSPLTNSVTEIFAERRAMVDYYKIQNDSLDANLVDSTHIHQEDNSEVSVHTFSFGGNLTRNNLQFTQAGSRCNSILKGVTILEKKQHVDHATLVRHQQPDCESHQDYKGIFSDRGVGVFNGSIIVDKIAQRINAFQQNNNILVDDTATCNSKPQLEIFADDVRCSHGCTIGQLDDEALFYLRSRGIGKKEARALLMYAFANNVLDSVKIPELKKRINRQIALKLGVQLGFDL